MSTTPPESDAPPEHDMTIVEPDTAYGQYDWATLEAELLGGDKRDDAKTRDDDEDDTSDESESNDDDDGKKNNNNAATTTTTTTDELDDEFDAELRAAQDALETSTALESIDILRFFSWKKNIMREIESRSCDDFL